MRLTPHPLPAAPDRLALPGTVQALAGVAVLFGAAALGWAFARGEATLAWSAYLIGVFFALGLGVFGLAWLSILNLSGGDWSVTMRRIPEAMTAWLIPGGVLAMLVGLGAHSLYHWSDTAGRRRRRAAHAQGAVPEPDDVHGAGRREPGAVGRVRAADGERVAPAGPRRRHGAVAHDRSPRRCSWSCSR